MVDYLVHIYKKSTPPFRSLSSLPDGEATRLMRQLYRERSAFWERFQDPSGYLTFRRHVEEDLREKFIQKGGVPLDQHPIYLMLGRPKWTVDVADAVTVATTDEVVVPLDIIDRSQVSFTYPDSMVSAFLLGQSHLHYFEPEYHGKVFTLEEIAATVEKKGLPGEGWETSMPRHLAHYIEAQVWNREVLINYYQALRIPQRPFHGRAVVP
jgi:hypothetical protein